MRIAAQPGPQEEFLRSPADIAIYGGAAGAGKTYALLLKPLYHRTVKGFGAVVFRRSVPQITNEGGLWHCAQQLYAAAKGRPKVHKLMWTWEGGFRVSFRHLEHESTKYDWHGAQVPLMCFDELTSFTRTQFTYMLSRVRSVLGVPGRVRATCNADADSWVAGFVDWWIDQDTGFAIPERSGQLRWVGRDGDSFVWGATQEEVEDKLGPASAMSVAFIPGKLSDNPALMAKDPGYVAKLRALGYVHRQRLELGNWKIREKAGTVVRSEWFEVCDAAPAMVATVRFWDRAATTASERNPEPDWTAGVKMGVDGTGAYWVLDVKRARETPGGVANLIRNVASQDGQQVEVWCSLDPAQAGKAEAFHLTSAMPNVGLRFWKETGDKLTRAAPFAAAAYVRNVKVLRGIWNDAYFSELDGFPDSANDDQVDATSGAFHRLAVLGPGQAYGGRAAQTDTSGRSDDAGYRRPEYGGRLSRALVG